MVPEEIREGYWRVLRRTRSSGRIAPSVVARTEAAWGKYDDDVVEEALRVHINKYPGYKENYTLGIMRNMQREKDAGRSFKRTDRNRFNNFTARDYDFDDLEQKLLAAQDKGG